MRAPRLLAALAAVLALAGCDQAATDTFTFNVNSLSFTFDVQGSTIAGQRARINAANMEALLDDIEDEGFVPADVVSMHLVGGEAQIELLNSPDPGTNIDVLRDVTLSLVSGSERVEVAGQDDFGAMTGSMAREADLDVIDADFSAVGLSQAFSAVLDAEAQPSIPDGAYRLAVSFDVVVEVAPF